MAVRSQHISPEPAWPVDDDRDVVVISDAASKLELSMVRDWIERNIPDGVQHQLITIPPSRRRKPTHRIDHELGARLAKSDNPVFVPIRIVWLAEEQDGTRGLALRDFLTLQDPRDPDVITQHMTLRRSPERVKITLGEPATAAELRAQWQTSVQALPLEVFVAHRAWLALERAERRLRGTRYKIPKLVKEELLHRRDFRDGLAALVPETGTPMPELTKKATRYLKEIAASHSPFVIDLVASAIRLLYRQGYGTITYDADQFQELYALGARYPLVFLPSHKSNLDHLVLQYLLWENNLPPNHTAGGINMNFFPVGPVIRRTGVFFIRRTFKDNPTYKYVLRSYIEYLIEKRFPLEWYLEGGRSRSGKLLPPRFGLLVYVADALRNGRSDEIYLIPTSIVYDHIQEVRTYAAEQRGVEKERESVTWLVRTVRSLRKRYGNIHLRFGEPVALGKEIDPGLEGDERHLAIKKVAFEVSLRINHVTPITPNSLVTVALLIDADRAKSLRQLDVILASLIDEVKGRGLPTTVPLDSLRTPAGLTDMLDNLAEHGIVSAFEDGPDTVYRIVEDQHLAAAFYRNTIIHFFVNDAIAELALVAAQEAENHRLEVFWDEVANLRDLLKFEFFFSEREAFREEIHQSMARRDPQWEAAVERGGNSLLSFLTSIRPLHAPWVLRPFLEAYDVVGQTLQHDPIDGDWDEKAFLAKALARGEQYRLQKRIRAAESVSQTLFKTTLDLAANRDLIDEADPGVHQRRRSFAAQVRATLGRVDVLDTLVASRRTGLID